MPAEVISLLSSSPVGPSHTTAATSSRSPTQNHPRVPHKTLDYGIPNTRKSAVDLPSCASTRPIVGAKRTSNHDAHHGSHNDHDFLYLSDDFDTTGDLDASSHKKPRTSAGILHRGKEDNDPASANKAKSARHTSSHRDPLRPLEMKRWGNVTEDIEFSSSPVHFAPSRPAKKAPQLSSDPFASSQRDPIPKPASPKSASPGLFCSSPRDADKNGGQGSWNWPADLRKGQSAKGDHDSHRSSKTAFIDLSSDPINSPPPPKQQIGPPNAHSKAKWDPISSSAPESYDIQDLLSSPPARPRAKPYSHHRTTTRTDLLPSDSDELPDLDEVDFSKIRATRQSNSSSSRAAHASKPSINKVAKSTEEKENEKKQKAQARETEKERKRVEKARVREERALQKEKEKALAEVNKLRTDKKVSAPEMIVDIPASINPGLKVQIEALLGELDVQHETWNSTVDHVVKWRRKVTSRFDEDMEMWKPIPMCIQNENHVLVIIQAVEFVQFVFGDEGQDLEAHVLRMKSQFPDPKLVYLIEGLSPWMRKNRNLLNRQFASAVRNLGASTEPGPSSSQSRRRNNNQFQEYIDEDKIEDALLSLQVLHGTLVHHTNAPVETAQWVAVFTQHISTIPYRKARDASADAGFCMESGQVRTGDGSKDTYIRMLQEIARVTAPIAYGIAMKYESVTDLIRGLEAEGPLALAECRKSANKDGALTDRTIGQAISKRVHKIFLGRDPTSTDV
ncbi:ERCC4 domain-containing protein [Nemania sp. FL0031]|nr:ERCC4 domain-containing protein [Nemania sp. FL0031]